MSPAAITMVNRLVQKLPLVAIPFGPEHWREASDLESSGWQVLGWPGNVQGVDGVRVFRQVNDNSGTHSGR